MNRLACMLLLPVLSAMGDAATWTADESMLLYFDAAATIRGRALEPRTLQDIVTGSLAGYVQSLDPHSRYLTGDAFADWKQHQASDYAGVGMELAEDRQGRFVCLPYPGLPAERAGIRDGDRLLAVDGTACADQDLVWLGMRVRGPPDSTVRLRVAGQEGTARELEVVRQPLHAPSVVIQGEDVPRVRIFRFAETTTDELAASVAALPGAAAVILDLRGNPGGSLYDAMDSAALFLSPGSVVASIRTRDGIREHRASKPPPFPDRQIWLLQDERTASSAELFVAALVGHHRARSMGARTAGKGTTQSMIPLIDGAALLLTVGELLGPDGARFHETGLAPSRSLAIDPTRLDSQIRQVLGAPPPLAVPKAPSP